MSEEPAAIRIADLRARLSAVEAERDSLKEQRTYLRDQLQAEADEQFERDRAAGSQLLAQIDRRRAAEARVEALQAVADAAREVERILRQSGVTDSRITDLRAALAALPVPETPK